ncbi:Mechanosensitive ion channel-domain-containing protein [Collybia nuda]|uniref:Mechanosensitive ion channel-domain-containing protein n=1 Tax=Collybia nuda TaxID=64659 RepID=A0A9P6CCW2_9AGAR|nr:Mechanosensitive ion channel-domain-containing protein [Collybia nuda]
MTDKTILLDEKTPHTALPITKEHDFASHSDTTATNSSDEFNWDEEETFYTAEDNVQAKRGRAIWLGFMKLARPIRVVVIGVLVAGVLIAPLLIVNIRFVGSFVTPHVHVWSLWLTIVWTSACVTYLMVDAMPRIVVSVIVLLGGQVERLKTQLELTMAVSAWLKLVLDISWAWISLSILRTIYHPPGQYWIIINRVMQAMFATGIILLVEKLFLQFVAINFHEKALADRLLENRKGLKALDRLSNAQPGPIKRSPYTKRGHKSPSASIDLFGASVRHNKSEQIVDGPVVWSEQGHPPPLEKSPSKLRHREKQRKRKKAMTSVIVDQLGGAIGQVALKNSKFNKGGELGSLHSARRLARKLFSALSDVSPARSHLLVEDFYPYFRTTIEAVEAFALFDKDINGDISKREMREAVQRIYRERKALVSSLKDASSVVAKLDAVLLAVAFVGIIFVCLLVFNRENTLASLVPLATIILGFSFIFGHSAQTLFESLIFIFSTHVFDVGDLVMIDDQVLYVMEFGLFSTTFRRVDGQEIIAPNALLASSKLVHNLRRSKSMWESTKLMISYSTPMEVVEQLRFRINAYITENNRDWSGCALNIDKMEYQNAIHLVVAIEHRPNWQDWGGRWARRTTFMRNLKQILEDLDVQYTMPVQPVLLPQPLSYGANIG